MISSLYRTECLFEILKSDEWKKNKLKTKRSANFFKVPLTAVEGASPTNSTDGLVGSVGVRGGGGDQVVVHVTVESRLLGRGLLLYLKEERIMQLNSCNYFKTIIIKN